MLNRTCPLSCAADGNKDGRQVNGQLYIYTETDLLNTSRNSEKLFFIPHIPSITVNLWPSWVNSVYDLHLWPGNPAASKERKPKSHPVTFFFFRKTCCKLVIKSTLAGKQAFPMAMKAALSSCVPLTWPKQPTRRRQRPPSLATGDQRFEPPRRQNGAIWPLIPCCYSDLSSVLSTFHWHEDIVYRHRIYPSIHPFIHSQQQINELNASYHLL